jgi:hypothetical protein
LQNTNKQIITKIPIQFEALQQLDERFMKIKVWILNIGKNYNGSIFTKEAVMKALPSIALTPILGYIRKNEDGDMDFSDHRIVLEVDENGIREKYLGSAYGVIPENPNAKFELRQNEYGGMEEYLTVEGLLWTKFDEAIDIMNRDTIKFQSMELSEKYDGFFNNDGFFVFTDFKFFGCCILGNEYEPAIPKSTAEKMFTTSEVTSIINSKLEEYRNKFEKKEDKDVNHEQIMKDFGVTAEMLEKAGIKDIEKYDIEEFKEELRRILEESKDEANKDRADNQDPNNPNPNPAPNPDPNPNPAPNPDPNQDRQDGSFDKDGDKTNVVDEKQDDKRNNAKNDDKKAVEQGSEKAKEFDKGSTGQDALDEIKREMSKLREDYDAIKEEHDKLVAYKSNKEKEEHERAINSKIAEFEMLSPDDVKEVKENAHNYSIQEAEDKLFAILGRKQSSGKETQNKFAKFYVNHEKESKNEHSPSYDHYFTKHLKK